MSEPRREHFDELLADAALFGLRDDGAQELHRHARALGLDPERERQRWELVAGTAASVFLARVREPVPDTLMARLRTDALTFYARRGAIRWEQVVRPVATSVTRAQRGTPAERSPWLLYIAAAAAVLLAFAVLFGPPAAQRLAPAQARALLLESGAVDVRHPWQPANNPAGSGLEGDVVWSTDRQEGYLRLSGLRPNDPAERQYQLWIVDGRRGMPPVDGGVFDVPPDQEETVVPIAARLPVGEAKVFVITVEPPGGVVVSEQGERVAAVAGG